MITDLILYGENQHTEFKASFQKAVIETVVAFANTQGGQVIIGLADNGKLGGGSNLRFLVGADLIRANLSPQPPVYT